MTSNADLTENEEHLRLDPKCLVFKNTTHFIYQTNLVMVQRLSGCCHGIKYHDWLFCCFSF